MEKVKSRLLSCAFTLSLVGSILISCDFKEENIPEAHDYMENTEDGIQTILNGDYFDTGINTNQIELKDYQNIKTKVYFDDEFNEDVINRTKENLDSLVDINMKNYLSDEDIKNLEKIGNHKEHCSYETIYDTDAVISLIKYNSTKSGYTSIFDTVYSDVVESMLKSIFDDIKNDTNDLKSDYHIYNEMSIILIDFSMIKNQEYLYELFPCSYDKQTNTLLINEYWMMKHPTDGEKMLSDNIRYFMNSIKGYPCPCMEKTYKGVGYEEGTSSILDVVAATHSFKHDDLNMWIDLSRSDSSQIMMLGLFSDVTYEEFINAVNDNDYETIYRYFGLDTEEKVKEFYNVLYAVDAFNSSNSFVRKENLDATDFSGISSRLGNEHRLKLFKMYLDRLLDYQKTHNISLFANYAMFRLGEEVIMEKNNMMLEDTLYLSPTSFDTEYLERFNAIDNYYRHYLERKYRTSSGYNNIPEHELGKVFDVLNKKYYDNKFIDLGILPHILIDEFPKLENMINNDDINYNSYKDVKDKMKEYTNSRKVRII
ncbi:MAG: hypothetical protein IJ565_01980 [Bacilli bacterium]|nr:hypothetical protein [Bacilli bacterium]